MKQEELAQFIASQPAFVQLQDKLHKNNTIEICGTSGSGLSLIFAQSALQRGGIHIYIAEDRDAAAYLYNDIYELVDKDRVFFFPTAYKRSIEYNNTDPSGMVQRTAALGAIRNFSDQYIIVCTYPEAILEKVADMQSLKSNTITIHEKESIPQGLVTETLISYGFVKVDFVSQPGEYSVRGSIIDIFSFSDNKPYRIDFFGDEIDSIRSFDIGSQLSSGSVQKMDIISDTKSSMTDQSVSLINFAEKAILWVDDLDHTLKRFSDVRVKLINALMERNDDPKLVERMICSRAEFLRDSEKGTLVTTRAITKEREADYVVKFCQSPQPSFNKNFEMLAAELKDAAVRGYKSYILTRNKVQIERLENIFNSIGERSVTFGNIPATIHEGFTDHDLKVNFYTDHQIFNRYHKYTLHKEVSKSESLTIAELNALRIGDYVVHIDHGVGKFGGLVKTNENGKASESIKLVYRDNDVLFVNVHSLHKISKYKDKDSEPPKVYKLGSGAWQKIKTATKKHVKDIARELIELYAKRKQSKGFAFSQDNYMQYELEASFMYEDTPDQEKATKAVKADMESMVPMDRLICGDVGFGKTEIAMRAAFKAACDGKQVAVLVPTTVLSLQHYRSFSKRFKEFPIRVELISRAKSAKQVKDIITDLKSGRIDILIGTHKILGKSMEFRDLGLLIIDEEQKFGVASKEKLRHIKANVDTLTLTATPIPRTLQFSLMGSRDMSVIATPPPNRQPISTEVHAFNNEIIREAIEFELHRGGQLYFVHNRVQNIQEVKALLNKIAPEARIAVGHGQMNPEDLEKIMMDFIYGEYDILLATTIIESGIDISNANTMIINNAQNFGLSDLHQLRGRVGRSNRKAFCYLMIPSEDALSPEARRRMRAIEEFSDLGAGFNIAMQDLDIRGAGNILGAEQSGFIADVGFEAYQKILNEAVMELRNEEFSDMNKEQTAEHVANSGSYISDCQIDTDREAYIPDSYVSNIQERLTLYRELDNIANEEDLKQFEERITDRFGIPVQATSELINIVRLRWICIRLGFEKMIQKNGLIILHFVYNQSSPYYKSEIFSEILKHVTAHPKKYLFKQHNNRLQLTVREIKDSDQALRALAEIENIITNSPK